MRSVLNPDCLQESNFQWNPTEAIDPSAPAPRWQKPLKSQNWAIVAYVQFTMGLFQVRRPPCSRPLQGRAEPEPQSRTEENCQRPNSERTPWARQTRQWPAHRWKEFTRISNLRKLAPMNPLEAVDPTATSPLQQKLSESTNPNSFCQRPKVEEANRVDTASGALGRLQLHQVCAH